MVNTIVKVVGVDPSLSSTGIAVSGRDAPYILRPPRRLGTGPARLDWFHKQFSSIFLAADVVVVEGYAYGYGRGGTSSAYNLGELGGVLRLAVVQRGCRLAVLPPARTKMVSTGKGNANKLAVFAAARDRLGYQGDNDNESDALWLLEAGLHLVEHPDRTPLPKTHLRALRDVEILDLRA